MGLLSARFVEMIAFEPDSDRSSMAFIELRAGGISTKYFGVASLSCNVGHVSCASALWCGQVAVNSHVVL